MSMKWQGIGVHSNCGTVEGIVLVDENVQSATERLLAMPEGEKVILVTSWLQLAWSGILRRVQGVITERGGVLSNAAIVAAELGLAMVAGVDGAASVIPDGRRIRVDGVSGMVEILEE